MIPCLMITHNRISFTKQALQSVLDSDLDEIFIWDNASDIDTIRYIHSVQKARIKPILFAQSSKNVGITPAFNWFLEETRDYEYIVKVDNDTIIPKDFCARMLPHMAKAEIVQAKHPLLKATHSRGFDEWVKTMPQEGDLRFNVFVGGSGVMMKRSVLTDLPHTDWILYSWTSWQRAHPEIKKAFCTSVEIQLLDTDESGAKYPNEYKNYYKETRRL